MSGTGTIPLNEPRRTPALQRCSLLRRPCDHVYTNATVGKWRRRFLERRISGLYDDLHPGKPRSIDDERVAELIVDRSLLYREAA
jgi:hypothetical protein